ncbi:MAG: hypothetical protein DYG92_05760 [Leptolyngbya sp. PLA1]|nr:hypothetical protein [Leptolyngbya sp. PLA1]
MLALALAAGGASIAQAQTHLWVNPAGGCWCTPTNWGPPSVPNQTSVVDISVPGQYTVGFSTGVAYCSRFSLLNPDATLALRGGETLQLHGTTHRVDGVLRIGDAVFGSPAAVEAFVPPFVLFEGTGRVVLNAHPQLVLPFAVIRASGRPVTTAPGIRLEGRGAVQADLTLQGTLAPGVGPGAIGEIQVDRLILGPSSVLEFDIAGPAFAQADRLQVSFPSIRAGTLRVRLAPGFVPSIGQPFTLITFLPNGAFDALDAPGFELLPGSAVAVRYVGFPCDPDLNQDGNADQDDVAYLVSVVGGGENPTGIDPDFNRDGNADQDDIAALIGVIAGGPCP